MVARDTLGLAPLQLITHTNSWHTTLNT